MFTSIIKLALHFDQSRSLKEKRQLLRSITEKLKHRFNISIAEVADQNLWQKATVGITYVSISDFQANKQALVIKNFIENLNKATISQYDVEVIKAFD